MIDTTISLHNPPSHDGHNGDRVCIGRRRFLLTGGALVALVSLGGGLPSAAEAAQALRSSYERRRIGSLAALKKGIPQEFFYPYPDVRNILVKLGVEAGGGVGPGKDIVAFNQQCTHMGGPLANTYKDQYQILGPCPLHLTTFDLTRYGMVVSGHATESLPQIVLEIDGDDICAVGVQGLVYGYGAMTDYRQDREASHE